MEQTECSETSAYKIQTPGNYPEENIQHTEHGESLKSRTLNSCLFTYNTFIKLLYMFRALILLIIRRSMLLIVYVQPLVSSFSAGDCLVHRLRKDDVDLLMMSRVNAQNM
jgi:hypothetical protein